MILMWLGSLALLLFGLVESQKAIAHAFSSLQKNALEENVESSNLKLFLKNAILTFFEASPSKSLYSGMAAYNLRVLSLRSGVLWMCLSTLGAWWILVMGAMFLNLNGLLFLGLGFFAYVLRGQAVRQYLRISLFIGLFLLGGELALRNSAVLLNSLGTGEFVFFMADGRLLSVLGILCLGVVLSFFISVEFWSVCFALCLLVANIISVNGALGLFAGERIGRMILFWWRTRSLNQDCRRVGWQLAMVSASAAFLGFMIAGLLRGDGGIGFSGEMDLSREKLMEFLSLSFVILIVQFVAQMIWGHFGSQMKVDEIQEARYIPKSWLDQELLSVEAVTWIRTKVQKRISEIRYHRQGLQTVKEGQIPEAIQARLKAEEEELSRFLQD
ncbi:hypothetical protein [Bdellovibrio sp. HCB2-146]|uniref:hypothetical protein n=1 Tax=Bdellovibrio sp. HCB2-146 TaxID=3394362 RepID=UPI0039BCEFBA